MAWLRDLGCSKYSGEFVGVLVSVLGSVGCLKCVGQERWEQVLVLLSRSSVGLLHPSLKVERYLN